MTRRMLIAFAVSVMLAAICGCSSVEYSKGGGEFHPGHPGHEVHSQ